MPRAVGLADEVGEDTSKKAMPRPARSSLDKSTVDNSLDQLSVLSAQRKRWRSLPQSRAWAKVSSKSMR